MTIFLIIIAILALFFLIIDIIDINRLVKREYVIESDKLNKEMCIVMLADLHNRSFGKDNERLLSALDDIRPDYICCAGDMILAKPGRSYETAANFMQDIAKYPVYYGIGNHEYRSKIYPEQYGTMYEDYIKHLTDNNINVIENGFLEIEGTNISLHGIMIDRSYYKRFKKYKMSADYVSEMCGPFLEEKYNILIGHNPEYFEAYAGAGADLVFAGHVHGGIMRLPLLGGVISPKLTLFPKYSGGRYELGNSTMVLSCGLGCHTLPLRIFNPGEISVIRLKPCSK